VGGVADDPNRDLTGLGSPRNDPLQGSAPGFSPLPAANVPAGGWSGGSPSGVNPFAASAAGGAMPRTAGHKNKLKRSGLPWDNQEKIDRPFLKTVTMVLFSPLDAFYKMRRKGDMGAPLTFSVYGNVLGGVATVLYILLVQAAVVIPSAIMSEELQTGAVLAAFFVGAAIYFVANLVGLATGAVIGSFVTAGLMHVCLMICGGARQPFETTFRVVCYAMGSTAMCQVIPLGGLITGILNLVHTIIGLYAAHETTGGKAAAAVLLPVFVCLSLCGVILFLVVPLLVGTAATMAPAAGG